MECKINRNAANVLKRVLQTKEAKGKMLRVVIAHQHHDHAHYELALDEPNEHDAIVHTDKGIDVLLDTREDFLDGVFIQYFYVPQQGFVITNQKKSTIGK